MGKRAPRFNQKARAASLPATALPHPKPRDTPEVTEASKKMSKKKRIRFEKFVERQLKKENRVLLMDKLKQYKSNDLFQSSKHLGRNQSAPVFVETSLKRSNNEDLADASLNSDNESDQDDHVGSDENTKVKVENPKKLFKKVKVTAELTVYESSNSDDDSDHEILDNLVQEKVVDLQNIKESDKSNLMLQKPNADMACLPPNNVKQQNDTMTKENIVTKVKPAFYVPVHRSKKISVARMSLPVVGEEQLIMETIMENDVTVLCSETGSGKTTQLPQFLYEAGFGHPDHSTFSGVIGITQPRRVAAVSMAARVSHEMNLYNGEVSYQIRYDKGQVNSKTRIKFMTDGILLRELSQGGHVTSNSAGLLLADYSCIIIDEAHERTVGTDILLGWLTRVVKLRNSGRIDGVKPLKLVIMSATLRVEDFTENKSLFPQAPPPVINIPGRQHKVVVHYNRHTNTDYVNEAFKKAVKIHSRLPQGGILIFVTGQHEVQMLVRKLRNSFKSVEKVIEDENDEKNLNELNILEENQEYSDHDDYDLESMADDDSDSVQSEEEEIQILNGTVEDEDVEVLTESEVKNRGKDI